MKKRPAIGIALFGIAFWIVGATSAGAADTLTVTGAGATFPYPLYSKWFYEYSNAHPEVNFNYQSIGSGGGIKQITAGTVDFGASDAPMKDKEIVITSYSIHYTKLYEGLPDEDPRDVPAGGRPPDFHVPGEGDLRCRRTHEDPRPRSHRQAYRAGDASYNFV